MAKETVKLSQSEERQEKADKLIEFMKKDLGAESESDMTKIISRAYKTIKKK